MHATVHENIWGVRTTYGTHPKQPTRAGLRVRRAARHAAKATAVAALAAWYFVRR